MVVTPRRTVPGEIINRLIAQPQVHHHVWRGSAGGQFDGRRVLYAWPDQKHLNEVWSVKADAIAVIEWNVEKTAKWLEDVNPSQLLPGQTFRAEGQSGVALEPLPNGIDSILEHVAEMAAGYSTGLKWNEEDKLKADMMNRRDRWASVTVEQVRARCAPGAASLACAPTTSIPSLVTCSVGRKDVASTS